MKRKSKTAIKMKEQKISKSQRRMRGKKGEDSSAARSKKCGGSNGWGDDDGYDLPPEGGDEFDLSNLMGSVKKLSRKSNPLLDTSNIAQSVQLSAAGREEKETWTRKIQKVNVRDVAIASSSGDKTSAQSSKVQPKKTTDHNSKKGVASVITASTPIREIIESCSNPKPKQQAASNASSSTSDLSKQEKRKAFFEKKKLKKRKRGNGAMEIDDSDDYATHHQGYSFKTPTSQRRPAIDDQVERPPTFTMLPRGASKLAKNKKSNQVSKNENCTSGDDDSAALRIQREQQALEAMRQKVMKQYAILRESRRAGKGR